MAKRTSNSKSTPADSTGSELQKVLKMAGKRYGSGIVTKASDVSQPDRIPTGVFALDFALLGGIPSSRTSMFVGERHSGKAQDKYGYVLTPNGWTQFKDLGVGDHVVGSNGLPTRVTGVYPRGVQPMYRVSFTDKSSVVVAADHLWHVQSRKQYDTTGNFYVLTTEELSSKRLRGKPGKRNSKGICNFRIPMVAPVHFARSEPLPIDPYVLGVLLANGYIKYTAIFTSNDVGIVDEVSSRLGGEYVVKRQSPNCEGARHWLIRLAGPSNRGPTPNPVVSALRSLGLLGKLSRDKFIPEEYLRASVEDRLSLLNALMDCDGSTIYAERNNSIQHAGATYYSYSQKLAQGIQELAQSLGGTASISTSYREEDDVVASTVSIVLPVGLPTFRCCVKKVEAYEGGGRRGPVRSIASIVEEDSREAICIAVAAEDHLYVTEQYIVTHNSMLAMLTIGHVQRRYTDQQAILVDIEGTFDSVWATLLGVDTEALLVVKPETGEMAADMVTALLCTREVSMVVADSIAALVSFKEVDSSAEDSHVGLQARLVGGMIRKSTAAMIAERRRGHNVSLLFVNQFRMKIGGYGDPRTVPGGKALEYCTSMQAIIKNKENKGSDEAGIETIVSNEHSFTITKNKLNTGPRVGEFRVIRTETDGMAPGTVDDSSTVLAIAKKLDVYTGGGSSWRLDYEDVNYKFGKAAEAVTALQQDPELYWSLRTHLIRLQAARSLMPEDFIERIV